MPVYDQGYQHWKGHLSGHAWRWMAIARHGMRTQFRAWYVRILILAAWMPALLLVAVLALWGMIEQGVTGAERFVPFLTMLAKTSDLHGCRQAIWTISYSYFFWVELFFVLLIVTLCGPNLISRDLRFNALPLYFSRPMTRFDYFLGKLAVIAALVAAVAVMPAVLAYVLGVCFSLDLSVVRDTWRLLPAAIVYGLVIVVSAGTLMLAMSSMSRRSLYVGVAWLGVWLVSDGIAYRLMDVHTGAVKRGASRSDVDTHSVDTARQRGHGRRVHRSFDEDDEGVQEALSKAAKTDWRPLFSYRLNLFRLGEAALDTDSAWVKIVRVMNSSQSRANMMFEASQGQWPTESPQLLNERFLADQEAPQFPWIWSAAVLAGLFVLSSWVLSMRVKSLDRLR
jgi:ABC-2 type transport system permease protein